MRTLLAVLALLNLACAALNLLNGDYALMAVNIVAFLLLVMSGALIAKVTK